jgi:hypothetical protein
LVEESYIKHCTKEIPVARVPNEVLGGRSLSMIVSYPGVIGPGCGRR